MQNYKSCGSVKGAWKTNHTKDHKLVADEFNLYFLSVGRKVADAAAKLATANSVSCMGLPCLSLLGDELFNFKTVTCEDLRRIIFWIHLNTSPGPD